MNNRERVMAALNGEATDRAPVFSANQTATYEQMVETGAEWPDAHQQAEPMATLALGAHMILGFDAVRVPYCQTMESEALGSTVKYAGREGIPRIGVHGYEIGDSISYPDDFLERGRIPALLEAIRILKEKVGDKVAVGGNIVGPFSIASNLLEITDVLKASFKKPEALEPYLEVSERAGTELGKALVEAGADFIVIEDMMASMDIISSRIYERTAQPWERRQIDNLPDVPTIIHICGKVNSVAKLIAETGATAISVEPNVDAPAFKQDLQDFAHPIPLIGGVAAAGALFSGSVADVRAEVERALADGYDIIAPGCSIPPSASSDILRTMVATAEEVAAR